MTTLEGLVRRRCGNRTARRYPRVPMVVAIPVRNEAERILRCVDALDAQQDAAGTPLARGHLRVVLLTNACTDGTFDSLFDRLEAWRTAVEVVDVVLPDHLRHAGYARYLANHAALDLLDGDDGLLFMTDADSCVPSTWIATYAAMLRSGYDAVIGRVDLHPGDSSEIPLPLQHRCAQEERYAGLLDRLESCIDPLVHDPWPRHYNASGANLAMRVDALAPLGDFPVLACGEDKALAHALERCGCRLRHDCGTLVHTSGRLFGRAVGGMADTLRHRLKVPGTPCDERLEGADDALFRASLRRALRQLFARGDASPEAISTVLARFEVQAGEMAGSRAETDFATYWDALERSITRLGRRAIIPNQLPIEIKRAESLLQEVQRPDWSFVLVSDEERLA
jgi:hypothetical protein